MTVGIERLKDLCLETRLVDGDAPRAVIVTPADSSYSDSALLIREAIEASVGVRTPVVVDRDIVGERGRGEGHLIALGCLADNAAIEQLYFQWLTLVDRGYPGVGGYALHTVHDPWGDGCNAVVVGGSDAAGVAAGAAELSASIGASERATLGRLHSVKFGPRLVEIEQQLAKLAQARHDDQWGFGLRGRELERSGFYYLLSGHEVFAERFREGLLRMSEAAPERSPEVQVHLTFFTKMILWDLLEESPVFDEGERLQITRYLLDVLRSEEGFANEKFQEVLSMEAPRQNHQTILALGLLLGARYFDRYYDLPEAKTWLSAVDQVFAGFARHTKPACDCSDHGWRMTLPTATAHAMVGGGMEIFATGALREAADRAIVCCNNLGSMPALGDSSPEAYPTELFAQAAHYYGDGRYAYMLRKYWRSRYGADSPPLLADDGDSEFERAFDSGVEPVEPADLAGIAVAPMDRQYYDMPANYPRYAARLYGIPMPEPNVPLEQTFDNISLRTGFSDSDQYLLLEGCGGGNHSYEDANAIVEFSQFGRVFLITEDRLHWPEYRSHNVVTVTRNGTGATSPSFAALELAQDFERTAFVRSKLTAYNGVDWYRNIIWLKGYYYVIVDELVARVEANYALQCHWKMIGDARLEGGTFEVDLGGERAFVHSADDTTSWLELVDIGLSVDHEEEGMRQRQRELGLGEERLEAHTCHQRMVRRLAVGERAVFHNLLYARSASVDGPAPLPADAVPTVDESSPPAEAVPTMGEEAGRYAISRLGDGCVAVHGDQAGGRAGCAVDLADVQTDAELFFAGHGWFAVAGARSLVCGGEVLLSSDDPVSVECCPSEGVAIVEAPSPTRITLPAGGPDSARLDGRWVLAQGQLESGHQLVSLDVPAGRHRIELEPLREKATPPGGVAIGEGSESLSRRDRASTWDSSTGGVDPTAAALEAGVAAAAVIGSTHSANPRWTFAPPSPVSAVSIDEVAEGRIRVTVGCDDGTIAALTAGGETEWLLETGGGRVNTICRGDLSGEGEPGEVVAGSDDGAIYAISDPIDGHTSQGVSSDATDSQALGDAVASSQKRAGIGGQLLWSCRPEFGYQHWPWWTQGISRVRRVLADDLDGDGYAEVIAGCANMRLHLIDREGRERWNRRTDHGIFATLTTADVDGDGAREIVGGLCIKGANSACSVLAADGELRMELINYGWTSQLTAVAVDDLDGDGALEIACGTNRGDNVRVFSAATGELRWQQNLGDPVTGLATLHSEGGTLLVAASPSCYVCAFDADGGTAWVRDLNSPISRLGTGRVPGTDSAVLLAGCADGSSWALDREGRVQELAPRQSASIDLLWSGCLADGTPAAAAATAGGVGVWSLTT